MSLKSPERSILRRNCFSAHSMRSPSPIWISIITLPVVLAASKPFKVSRDRRGVQLAACAPARRGATSGVASYLAAGGLRLPTGSFCPVARDPPRRPGAPGSGPGARSRLYSLPPISHIAAILSHREIFDLQRRHYHLIGIAGTAMGSLAGLLKAAGHHVTGSDENVYPPMSTQLEALGIPYAQGFRPENLEPRPDVVVVGNAISRGNPELEYVLDEGLYYTAAAVVIKEEFLRGRHVLAVAGTHGKTTTTSILAWLLEVAGFNPSFLIGGVAENFGSSFRLTDSEFFVIEADEYDTAYFDKGPKMWHYLPRTAIVNNVEFDHADIFRDDIAYRWAFERFINLIPQNGTLVAGWDSAVVRELARKSFAPIESFGYDPS